MVATRGRAAMDERRQIAAESPDRTRGGRKRRRSEMTKDTAQEITQPLRMTLRKRQRRELVESGGPPLRRRSVARVRKEASEDVGADSAPHDPSFFNKINKQASVKKNKRRMSSNNDEKGAEAEGAEADEAEADEAEAEAEAEAEEADAEMEAEAGAEAEARDHQPTTTLNQAVEPGQGEQQDSACEGDESSPDEDERDIHIGKITRVTPISVDMTYIEPEPEDVHPNTIALLCSEVNRLIVDMKREGWTNQAGDWTRRLLCRDNKRKTDGGKDCKDFLAEAKKFLRIIQAMSKDPAFQSQGVRECSQDIKMRLSSMRILAQRIQQKATKAKSRASKSEYIRLVKSIRKTLIPILVHILKEALLLGGSSRTPEDGQPEKIGPEKGTFMACTLQFALCILGCIDQLYIVIRDFEVVEDGGEANQQPDITEQAHRSEKAHRRMFGLFYKHLSALEKRLSGGMKRLIEESPRMRHEMKERDRRAYALQDKEEQRSRKNQQRQFMDFIASTETPLRQIEESRTSEFYMSYYQKHGWEYGDDEYMLDMIRKVKSPNVETIMQRFPGRTVGEVEERLKQLRDRMRDKFKSWGRPPPKWCY